MGGSGPSWSPGAIGTFKTGLVTGLIDDLQKPSRPNSLGPKAKREMKMKSSGSMDLGSKKGNAWTILDPVYTLEHVRTWYQYQNRYPIKTGTISYPMFVTNSDSPDVLLGTARDGGDAPGFTSPASETRATLPLGRSIAAAPESKGRRKSCTS